MRTIKEIYMPPIRLADTSRIDRIVRLGWTPLRSVTPHTLMWRMPFTGLMVIEGVERHRARNGLEQAWHHVSVSHAARLPTWYDMADVKRVFIGEDAEAYMIAPPKARHVNLGEVLHWYSCLDRPDGVLPDFRVMTDGGVQI